MSISELISFENPVFKAFAFWGGALALKMLAMSMLTAAQRMKTMNPIFKTYAFWTGLLVLKMLAMSILTGLQRQKTQTFANPEDALIRKAKVKFDDPNVERVRRAHRNDMENILVFFPVGFLYVLTNPSEFLAINLFRVIGISRIVHTIVYAVYVVPQPARALSFFAAFLATGYMGLQVVLKAL